MELKIVEKYKGLPYLISMTSIILGIFLIVLSIFLTIMEIPLGYIPHAIIFLFCLIYLLQCFDKLFYNEIGLLKLLTDSLEINELNHEIKIPVLNVDKLVFKYYDYRHWKSGFGNFYKEMGLDNEINFKYKGKEYSFDLLIETEYQYLEIKGIINDWKKINPNVEFENIFPRGA